MGTEISEDSTFHGGRTAGREGHRNAPDPAGAGDIQEGAEGDRKAKRAIGIAGVTADLKSRRFHAKSFVITDTTAENPRCRQNGGRSRQG